VVKHRELFKEIRKKDNFVLVLKMESDKKEILATAVGRRKEAVAQVQLRRGSGEFIINNKPANIYLNNNSCSLLALKAPFNVLQNLEISLECNQIDTLVKVQGGGLIGQAEAIKLGIARAICQFEDLTTETNTVVKKSLKDKGFLTIDARVKERRKYGLKKARKASQYHKR
jgi:small subunit ribosomal protein S9